MMTGFPCPPHPSVWFTPIWSNSRTNRADVLQATLVLINRRSSSVSALDKVIAWWLALYFLCLEGSDRSIARTQDQSGWLSCLMLSTWWSLASSETSPWTYLWGGRATLKWAASLDHRTRRMLAKHVCSSFSASWLFMLCPGTSGSGH